MRLPDKKKTKFNGSLINISPQDFLIGCLVKQQLNEDNLDNPYRSLPSPKNVNF
jgi:hypothetical protein